MLRVVMHFGLIATGQVLRCLPVLRAGCPCGRGKCLRAQACRRFLCVHCLWQVWSYTSAYAHLRICMELAYKKSHGVALKYDELCRLEWQERAKRGGHDCLQQTVLHVDVLRLSQVTRTST